MPPASAERDIDAQIKKIQAGIARQKKKLSKFRSKGGRGTTAQFLDKIRAQEDQLTNLLGERDIAGLEGISERSLSEEQKSGLFGQAQAATEAATRESVGDLAARFGGDTSNPLFNFLQQTTRAAGAATGAGQRLGIEVEEGRRAQDIGLQKQQLRLGFGQLGLSRRAQQFQERFSRAQLGVQALGRFGGGGGGSSATTIAAEGARFQAIAGSPQTRFQNLSIAQGIEMRQRSAQQQRFSLAQSFTNF